jgi:gliding motility-associated lipoprotein GldD
MNNYLKHKTLFFAICSLLVLTSCKDDVLPKPSSQLRLEYPKANYTTFDKDPFFLCSINNKVQIKEKGKGDFEIHYPKMKATIYLTYKPINGNLKLLLKDAQKLTYEHVIKADEIIEQPFVNKNDKVYGMFYTVGGNAATNAQFYATDSIKNFVTGSMYFYAKPNFDSILPAAEYIKNDMQTLMETLKWK